MAMGRYTRNDGKKSSSCCSTITIVVMVSACLIGAWIMMPSIMEPGVTKEFKQQKVMETNSRGFVDSYGRDEGESNSQREEIVNRESERSNEVDQEEKLEKDKSDEDEKSTSSDRKEEGLPSGDQGIGDRTGEDKFDTMDQKQSNENTDDSDQKQSNENTDDSDQKQSNKNTDDSDQKQSNENTEDIEHKSDENERNSGEGESSKEKIEETETQDEVDSKSLDKSKDTNEYSSERTTETGTTDQAEILNESSTQIGSWSTQSKESEKQKASVKFSLSKDPNSYRWKLCNVTAGPDYIPCLDNIKAIRKLPSTSHYEHRERHCPDEAPTCLVSLPEGYRTPVKWPKSREKIWFANVPHVKLAEVKGHQNWVQVSGDYLTFPGGGTQFTHGALHYIDFIQKTVSDIAWGKRTRVILDVGCGVASFGGYLFDRDVIAISLAPKDEHEAQTQFALERGIPAISAVMGTKRLPFPSRVFDIVHCARCRVPWHIEGGKLLLELNRVLRPGGFFVWSATPVYRTNPEDSGIWKAMSKLTKAMCWELVSIGKDKVNGVSAAVYRKPTSNECYETRARDDPPLCQESDDPNAAWDVPLQACIHKLPTDPSERGSQWPAKWPSRLEKTPYWLRSSEVGVYGKAAPKDFSDDYKHWKLLFANSYLNGIGIDWTSVRNVMDMRAVYGGFAAALKDLKVWVMNVVPISSSDTLPIIYERGLFGIYHDWCESFNTYPRTYDLLHADHLFSDITKRCEIVTVMAEVDRILRPEGKLIVKDDAETVAQVETMAKSLHWKILFTFSKDGEGLLSVQKTRWRPTDVETIYSAIA